MPTATAGYLILADSTRMTRSAHKQWQSITIYECLSPCPSGSLPNWTALDLRRASSNGTLHLLSPPLHTPQQKKKNSFRLPCSGAPLGAPLDGKKKGGCGRVRQRKNHCRQQRMLIANQYSLRYDWVSFISELRCRCRHIVAM